MEELTSTIKSKRFHRKIANFLCTQAIKIKSLCAKNAITFDKLPQAITYLTEQIAELKQVNITEADCLSFIPS